VPEPGGRRSYGQQPEHPRGVGRQVPVGPGEHAGHGASHIAARVQQFHPAGQAGKLGQRRGWAGGGQLSGHPQGQTQATAAGTLTQLPGNTALTRLSVNRWETGRRIPRSGWRQYLSKALDIPLDVLDRAAAVSARCDQKIREH
jgi:hypothetical protein